MMDFSKEKQYRELADYVRAAYQSGARDLLWCSDCREINLWTYWQGRGHYDAQIMLVGQDWGSPWDFDASGGMEKIRELNRGKSAVYMEGNDNPTDNHLVELFHSIGFDIMRDAPDLFFTNFVLGYREKGISGGFKDIWARQDAPFFCRLANIIKPHIILCLGKDTFIPVLRSLNCEIPKITSYNRFIESDKNPVKVKATPHNVPAASAG